MDPKLLSTDLTEKAKKIANENLLILLFTVTPSRQLSCKVHE